MWGVLLVTLEGDHQVVAKGKLSKRYDDLHCCRREQERCSASVSSRSLVKSSGTLCPQPIPSVTVNACPTLKKLTCFPDMDRRIYLHNGLFMLYKCVHCLACPATEQQQQHEGLLCSAAVSYF